MAGPHTRPSSHSASVSDDVKGNCNYTRPRMAEPAQPSPLHSPVITRNKERRTTGRAMKKSSGHAGARRREELVVGRTSSASGGRYQRQGARMRHGPNVVAQPQVNGQANQERAVAFLASWRFTTVPAQKEHASYTGPFAPSFHRVADAVEVLRELRAASWATAFAVGVCRCSLMVRFSTRRSEGLQEGP